MILVVASTVESDSQIDDVCHNVTHSKGYEEDVLPDGEQKLV